MSRRRNYSPSTLAVMERFFAALDTCLESRQLRSKHSFCTSNGIDPRHLYAQRKDRGKGYFEVAWLLPLIEQCGISAQWLLTGKGMMFAQ